MDTYLQTNRATDTRSMIPTYYDALTLLLLAFITGVVFGLPAWVCLWALDRPAPYKGGLIVWSIVQAWAWIMFVWRWGRLLDAVEMALGVDLDQDGRIGQEPVKQTVRIEMTKDQDGLGRTTQIADLPFSVDQLARLGDGLASGVSFSEAAWTGFGKPFTRGQFEELRKIFLLRRWAAWAREDAPAQGVRLTAPGMAVVRHFASMAAAPSPTLVKKGPRK